MNGKMAMAGKLGTKVFRAPGSRSRSIGTSPALAWKVQNYMRLAFIRAWLGVNLIVMHPELMKLAHVG